LQRLCVPVYSALHGGRIETPEEGWRLLVEHLFCPLRFDLAFEAARRAGLSHCVEFGPGGTLERTVRRLGRDRIEVGAFPAVAPHRRRGVAWR
jgi:acyl transferase domain-containing protein